MTVDELIAREAIRHTLASYHMAGDRARADEYAAVFTEDGILETGGFRHEGRETIRRWMGGWGDAPQGAGTRRAKFVRHNITTSRIELTGPDTATGRSYFVVVTDIGPDHSGYYVDTFRKTGDEWLIAHRKARVDWVAADSSFAPPPASNSPG